MKNLFLLIAWILVFSLNAQVFNINPDTTGDPWWAGGVGELTQEKRDRINQHPVLELSIASDSTPLLDVVDNSSEYFMRPIFKQSGSSYAQASGIGYMYT